MKFKGTKGEWSLELPKKYRPSIIGVSSCKGMVNIYKAPLTNETKANAKLIAASLPLLESAKDAYVAMRHEKELSPQMEKAYYALESAIEKALN